MKWPVAVSLCRIALVVLFPAFLLLLSCCPADSAETFPKTYRAMALSKRELPKIVKTHPRLYLRQVPWAHGPSLTELKEWAKVAPLKNYLRKKRWDPKPRLEAAFRYLLTKDETLVPPIVEWMKAQKGYWPGYLLTLATVYDWLYNSPSFSAADKHAIEAKMVSWGKGAIYKGEEAQDMWSHFGYGPVTDLAAAGLAMYGHRPEAEDFLLLAGGYLKKNFLPGWQLNGGAWQGGWAYYSQGPAKLMILIHLWSSGTDEDLYQIIADEQGDWLRQHLHFLLSSSYGKAGPLETGGFSYSPFIKGLRDATLPITYAYQDEIGIAQLSKLKKVPWWAGVWQFIFYSPEMRGQQVKSAPLPLSMLWGRDGIGYAQMHSGWGNTDTLIDFKCGDYFWSHQFNNQNSFTIYHGGELAVQSGIYDAYWGRHMQFYYRPTVGSNSMLVIQPGETSWIPPGVANKNGVTNKKGYFAEFGGQRTCFMHPQFGSAETCFSFAKYLYRKDHQHHFETGTMQGWEVGDGYTYASGDVTMAYNNPEFSYPNNRPKLDHASRDLVFLDKKYLLVFDRVNALDPSYEKRWLLHTIGKPQIETEPISEEVPGHIMTYPASRVRIDNGEGTLFVETIFPEQARLRVVGGAPSLTMVKAASGNRGDACLETKVTGKYAAMGGSIAIDGARAEQWTIKFTSDKKFSVTGSKTGDDGQGSVDKLFYSKSSSLLIPKGNWQGKAKKGDSFSFATMSSSYRFWVNGKQNLPSLKKLHHVLKEGSKVHPGNWRIEVSPVEKHSYDSFLHFLTPTDRQGARAAEATGIRSDDGRLSGLLIDHWAVMFVELKGLGTGTGYRVAADGKLRHLLVGVRRNVAYEVVLDYADKRAAETWQVQSSAEGTLQFSTNASVVVTLKAI